MNKHILMLGTYDRHEYSRGRVLHKGLVHHGASVELVLERGSGKYWRLLRRLWQGDFNALLVTGKPALLLAWATKWRHKQKILFDVFISDFDTLVMDRKLLTPTSWRAKFYWWLDRFCCRKADFNILDTEDHVDYFVDEFNLPKEKFGVVYIGADDSLFTPQQRGITAVLSQPSPRSFLVEWHGTYIPLQGVEHIIHAAKLLENENIHFQLIGDGQTLPAMRSLASQLRVKNIEFVDPLPISQIPQAIARADLCLGTFGMTGKAQRVIANKCYEAMAMAKPLITGRTVCSERLIKDGAMLVESGDPKALAHAVLMLKRNPVLSNDLGRRGLQLYRSKFSPEHLGVLLIKYLQPLFSEARAVPAAEIPAKVKRKIVIPARPAKHIETEEPAEEPVIEELEEERAEIAAPAPHTAKREPELIIDEGPIEEELPLEGPEPQQTRKQRQKPAPTPPAEPSNDPGFLQKLDQLFVKAQSHSKNAKVSKPTLVRPPPLRKRQGAASAQETVPKKNIRNSANKKSAKSRRKSKRH